MRINTNVASLNAQEAAVNTNKKITNSLEKLSTGLRINKAADDASGLAIADKLRTQATSIGQGISNANSAAALIQIADKAMGEQSNILDTVKAKLIQASTSTTTDAGRESIRKDVVKLLEQFDNIAAQTNYNGITLLQKTDTNTAVQDTLTFQLGENKSFDVSVTQSRASNTASLGGGSDTITTGTNLLGGNSVEIVNASAVTLKNVRVASSGADSVGTAALNLTMSGNLSTAFQNTGNGNITLNAANETQATKDLLSTLAANYSLASYTNDVFTLSSGGSVDLSKMNFSAVTVGSANTNSTVSISVGTSTGFNVTNNIAQAAGSNQVDIASGGAMTGGDLLSSIKNLAADGLTNAKANNFMATIDQALTQLNATRADFGSTQNQLESSIRNMQTTKTNIKSAESVIRDVDYAQESATFNKQNIIAQAGSYAMSQANQVQQNVLRLLQ